VSDTPITDAAFDAMQEIPKDIWALRESMRDLERQRNQLLEALERLRDAEKAPRSEWKLAIANADIAIAKVKGEAQ
jgi:hypothetical protein